MDELALLKKTAQVVNNNEIIIEIDIRSLNLTDKLTGKNKRVFRVRRACLATLIHFSELSLDLLTEYTDMGEKTISDQIRAICTDAKIAVRMIAILLLDTDKEPSAEITRFLLKNLDTVDYHRVLTVLIDHSKVENFMNSIISIKGMSLLKTKEMIAFDNKISGELLEEQ